MPLFTERTQLDQDLAYKDSLILRALEAANHVAVTLDMSYREFWSLSPERLEAVLNADIPRTLAMFAGNTAFGTAANAALDAASYGTVRAPVDLPANVTFDGKKFTVTQTTNENV
jgi:hypothetical protein